MGEAERAIRRRQDEAAQQERIAAAAAARDRERSTHEAALRAGLAIKVFLADMKDHGFPGATMLTLGVPVGLLGRRKPTAGWRVVQWRGRETAEDFHIESVYLLADGRLVFSPGGRLTPAVRQPSQFSAEQLDLFCSGLEVLRERHLAPSDSPLQPSASSPAPRRWLGPRYRTPMSSGLIAHAFRDDTDRFRVTVLDERSGCDSATCGPDDLGLNPAADLKGLAAHGDQLYLTVSSGELNEVVALTLAGGTLRLRWRQQIPYSRVSPAADSLKVVVSGHEGMLVCLDAGEGRQMWSHQTSRFLFYLEDGYDGLQHPRLGKALSEAVFVEPGLLVAHSLEGLSLRDYGTGSLIWSNSTPCSTEFAPGVMADLALTTDSAGQLTAFDLRSGAVRWRTYTGAGFTATPVTDGHILYTATAAYVDDGPESILIAIAPDSGRVLWRTTVRGNRLHGLIATDRGLRSGDEIYSKENGFVLSM